MTLVSGGSVFLQGDLRATPQFEIYTGVEESFKNGPTGVFYIKLGVSNYPYHREKWETEGASLRQTFVKHLARGTCVWVLKENDTQDWVPARWSKCSAQRRGWAWRRKEGWLCKKQLCVKTAPTSLSPLLPGNIGNSSVSLSEMLCNIPQTRLEGMLSWAWVFAPSVWPVDIFPY